jgi:hypothetical protein
MDYCIYNEAYPEEMLIACQEGKPCEYGICDECPNTLRNKRNEDDEDG